MIKFQGLADKAATFIQREQLYDVELWKKFVDVYRSQPDGENQGWRGEYWGKMMRGAALVYQYTRDEKLYSILTDSVCDMMSAAEYDGRVSSYSRETEFDSWDIWCRKYVMLGCEYYLDICRDTELKKQIIGFISRCADYILAHIGADKKKITKASRNWFGVNSSSVLEPIVKLYNLTGEQRYLDFAAYIIDEGGAEDINIFELAYENKLYPYQYGVSKAYELTSCFEGLLEYYKVTKIEKYKTAVVNYAKAVMNSEISIIGCCGVTHELFDHTRKRQTVRYDGVMQETCVTVTWMKFCSRLLELTGDSSFADEMERSFYNAYLASLNTEKRESKYVHTKFADVSVEPTFLAFDSYCPLTSGKRGQKVGGNQLMPDLSYYGCCACIGAAGVGVFLEKAITVDGNVVTVNFFEQGRAEFDFNGTNVELVIDTEYPVNGNIKISVKTSAPVEFTLKLRNPGWSELPDGYAYYAKEWSDDTVELNLDMPVKFHYPEYWEQDMIFDTTIVGDFSHKLANARTVYHNDDDDKYIAVTRGPITLAADERTGKSPDTVFMPTHEYELCESKITEQEPCTVKLKFRAKDGEDFYLVDYASAGKDWKATVAAWLPN